MERKRIQYRDNSINEASVFTAPGTAKGIVICLPALGVRASYYRPFAEVLATKGYHVITVDWRGHGHSDQRASRSVDFGYEVLVCDLKEVLEHAEQWFSVMDVYLVGHSLGGQIGSLCAARYPGHIQGLVLIAACSVYYRGWEGAGAWRVWLAAKVFHPLSKLLGYFPGEIIGFGGREARKLMHDWCYNGLYGKYRPADSLFDYEDALGKMETPSLAISIAGDQLAPYPAVANLYSKFKDTPKRKHLELKSAVDSPITYDHFNWAKHPKEVIGQIAPWLDTLVSRGH